MYMYKNIQYTYPSVQQTVNSFYSMQCACTRRVLDCSCVDCTTCKSWETETRGALTIIPQIPHITNITSQKVTTVLLVTYNVRVQYQAGSAQSHNAVSKTWSSDIYYNNCYSLSVSPPSWLRLGVSRIYMYMQFNTHIHYVAKGQSLQCLQDGALLQCWS